LFSLACPCSSSLALLWHFLLLLQASFYQHSRVVEWNFISLQSPSCSLANLLLLLARKLQPTAASAQRPILYQ
jgi:hypothetical protein